MFDRISWYVLLVLLGTSFVSSIVLGMLLAFVGDLDALKFFALALAAGWLSNLTYKYDQGVKMDEREIKFIDITPGETSEVSAPTHIDGTPVDKEEAAKMHQMLVSGEMKFEIHPEALAEMEAMGMTLDDLRDQFIAATKKTMS